MSRVKKCYNEDCENNYMGCYCECDEIYIDESGYCTCYSQRQETEENKGSEGEV